jgi:hypothetical protein
MRAYVLTTGTAFMLISLAHVARIFAEGAGPLGQPIFLLTSILSLLLVVWAAMILHRF